MHPDVVASENKAIGPFSEDDAEVDINAYKRAWARLPAKVCPVCGFEMKVISFIENPDEIRRILRHLVKSIDLRYRPEDPFIDRRLTSEPEVTFLLLGE